MAVLFMSFSCFLFHTVFDSDGKGAVDSGGSSNFKTGGGSGAVEFLPASPKAKTGLGVQSLRPSVRPSVPKSCHRNSSETTDPIIMKLGM